MTLRLYMDQHVPRAITTGLRLRHIDVLTAYEDQAAAFSDSDLLDRASSLQRVLFSQDDDLLVEATKRQSQGVAFSGVIYGHQMHVTIGQCVHDLELIALIAETHEVQNQVIFLPL